MKNSKPLSTFRYLTLILLVALGLGAILAVLKGNFLLVGCLVGAAVLLALTWSGIATRCPKCKHFWHMKAESREPLFEEQVEVTENLNAWSATDKAYQSGSVTSSATRKAYKEIRKCCKCGHTETIVRTVNLK